MKTLIAVLCLSVAASAWAGTPSTQPLQKMHKLPATRPVAPVSAPATRPDFDGIESLLRAIPRQVLEPNSKLPIPRRVQWLATLTGKTLAIRGVIHVQSGLSIEINTGQSGPAHKYDVRGKLPWGRSFLECSVAGRAHETLCSDGERGILTGQIAQVNVDNRRLSVILKSFTIQRLSP